MQSENDNILYDKSDEEFNLKKVIANLLHEKSELKEKYEKLLNKPQSPAVKQIEKMKNIFIREKAIEDENKAMIKEREQDKAIINAIKKENSQLSSKLKESRREYVELADCLIKTSTDRE